MPRLNPSGRNALWSTPRARRSVSARSACSSGGRSGSDAVWRRGATITCPFWYGKRFSMTMLAAVVPRRSRSAGSPVVAAQKMQSRGARSPTYAIRHGAQSGCATRGSGLFGVRRREGLAVDAQAQLLPHLEEGHALRVHGDQLAGLRVAPLARLAPLHDEAPEAADLDPLALGQRRRHAVEDGVDHHLGVTA